jgi:chorismate mutase
MDKEIQKLRQEIDGIDDEIAGLLQRRAALARRIGEAKRGAPAYRPERESGILNRVMRSPGVLAASASPRYSAR